MLGAIEPRRATSHRLAALIERVEASPARRRACARSAPRSTTRGMPASRQIARATPAGDAARLAAEPALRADLAACCSGALQIACALEAWRARSGGDIAGWLDALGELRGARRPGRHAFEHPADPFPELVDDGPALRRARARSPAAPRRALRAQRPRRSTQRTRWSSSRARTCRARARSCAASARPRSWRSRARRCARRACACRRSRSARACACRIRCATARRASMPSCWRCAASSSAAQGPLPVLFLLDEILAGHQLARPRASARTRCCKGLLARGAIGLVTTHDLALTAIVDELAPRATQRPLRGPARERRAALRLPAAPGRDQPRQRARADALRGPGDLNQSVGPPAAVQHRDALADIMRLMKIALACLSMLAADSPRSPRRTTRSSPRS